MLSYCDVEGSSGNVLKYVIAAAMLGTAIGNIFVAKRMSNFMKQHAVNQASRKAAETSNIFYEFMKNMRSRNTAQKISNHEAHTTMPPKFDGFIANNLALVPHLRNLGLPLKKPTISELKEAFHKQAMAHHPDRFTSTDPCKNEHEMMFRECNNSYDYLINTLEKRLIDNEKEM
eukprot:gene3210-6341_t